MADVPHERSLVKRLEKKPFVIVGVNSDKNRDAVRKLCADKGITWRSFWDGGSTSGPIGTRWNVRGWPTLYLIDGKGVIRYKGDILLSVSARMGKDGKWEQFRYLDVAVDALMNEVAAKGGR
jgi:hypothetical protein